MPFLRVEQGGSPGQILEIAGERVVIGRHPSCEIVLDNAAVSRQHAQISESHGSYFLEDLRSRNRTFLNGAEVEGSVEVRDRDAIQVCDLTFRFFVEPPSASQDRPTDSGRHALDVTPPVSIEPVPLDGVSPNLRRAVAATAAVPSLDEPPANGSPMPTTDETAGREPDSAILGTLPLSESSGLRLGVRAEQKLRAVLDMAKALSNAIELDAVLARVLDGLFHVFPQADHGAVLLKEGEKPRLRVRAWKSRREGDGPGGVSMTVVRRAMKAGEAILSADVSGDSRFSESDSAAAFSLRSVVCVPLQARDGEPFGVVQLDGTDASRSFGREDLDLLAAVAGQIGLAVENARLHVELLAQRDMRRELDFAMQVQLGFLPGHPPDVPGYEFFDHYEAAYRVGGDYFDYVELPDGRIAAAVGDVAGKGVPAALLMARLFSSARYQLLTRKTPGAALSALNSEIARTALGHRFITCIFAALDPATGDVTIANAGHLAPLVRTADGRTEPFGQKESGLPVGIARDQIFDEVRFRLEPGDLMLMYTDGVTEAMAPDGDLYGRLRLTKKVAEGPDSVRDLIESIVSDLAAFADDRHQRDDVCLVGLRRLP